MSTETDELLTIAEVAGYLKVHVKTAEKMLAPGGRLHALRIQIASRTIRVSKSDLERHIRCSH
jgi:excisionase family DNA binding protein